MNDEVGAVKSVVLHAAVDSSVVSLVDGSLVAEMAVAKMLLSSRFYSYF